ncbi:TonB-dependent receptor [Methylovulum psychrotolerans]|uniref:TonB-dependent receptor n=1 Tax=Methylovulum psychrotolerans TaxID=1704499 RepID=A0A2S5CHP0_9GAMM|nr:TonB-dependent receptor [Methylovulum psychrotolerans]POZ50309.1 TonB-dependent receptor [Methylovulum psychrotolerans]
MKKIPWATLIKPCSLVGIGVYLSLHCMMAQAHPQQMPEPTEELTQLDTVEVAGQATDLIGIAASASQGVVGQEELKYRPLARVGELVEIVPGAVATQHSGSGKANQYFLRGFNLDHGTDFSVTLDGIPMNMPSHAHGQGYLDLNSVIPELIDKIEYGKGPYYADAGDFSAAGYTKMHTLHKLSEGLLKVTGGEFGYYRGVLANSRRIGDGDLLFGSEVNFYDGVWQQPENAGKYNGMLRYTIDKDNWGLAVNGKAYHATWTATNQIPERAITEGLIGLYGTGDPSDGGITSRYSLSGNAWNRNDHGKNDLNLYAVYSELDLFSNFTGYIDTVHGDQIEQKEHRVQLGGNGEHTRYDRWFGIDADTTVGLQIRHDDINGLALNHTQARRLLSTVRVDDISETSVGLYAKNEARWLEKFRSIAGLRGDFFAFDVHSRTLAANSGSQDAALISPKLSLIAGPWLDTELFLNMGYGYHSNDARGTVTHTDPATGETVHPVTPLARSRGAELGLRSQTLPGLNSTLALWWLESQSELVFVGDGGTTDAAGQSQRYGIEWTNDYKPTDWLTLEADFAFTRAYFTDAPAAQSHIPNSVGRVISLGATATDPSGLFGSLRLRHFGDVPLNREGTAWAGDTSIVNLGLGYQHKAYKIEVDCFNLFGSTNNDIAYFYGYRLQGETAGPNPDGSTDGIIKHPVEPRMVRVTASVSF